MPSPTFLRGRIWDACQPKEGQTATELGLRMGLSSKAVRDVASIMLEAGNLRKVGRLWFRAGKRPVDKRGKGNTGHMQRPKGQPRPKSDVPDGFKHIYGGKPPPFPPPAIALEQYWPRQNAVNVDDACTESADVVELSPDRCAQ